MTAVQTMPAPHRTAACTGSTKVLIVDDHSTFAELLSFALSSEDDFDCVGTADSVAQAVEMARRWRPNMVVMDIQLGRDSGLEAARQIRSVDPSVVVVVVSAHRDPTWVVRATQAGASAFAPKSGSLSEMLSVLRGARNGTMLVAPSLFTNRTTTPEFGGTPNAKLTEREREVLTLMGQGMSASPIARLLNISVHTCRGYVKTIHAKLDARSQLEAVIKAQRLGLIEASDAP
jgi:DNA-binding NarL/FixJ family response regulator